MSQSQSAGTGASARPGSRTTTRETSISNQAADWPEDAAESSSQGPRVEADQHIIEPRESLLPPRGSIE